MQVVVAKNAGEEGCVWFVPEELRGNEEPCLCHDDRDPDGPNETCFSDRVRPEQENAVLPVFSKDDAVGNVQLVVLQLFNQHMPERACVYERFLGGRAQLGTTVPVLGCVAHIAQQDVHGDKKRVHVLNSGLILMKEKHLFVERGHHFGHHSLLGCFPVVAGGEDGGADNRDGRRGAAGQFHGGEVEGNSFGELGEDGVPLALVHPVRVGVGHVVGAVGVVGGVTVAQGSVGDGDLNELVGGEDGGFQILH